MQTGRAARGKAATAYTRATLTAGRTRKTSCCAYIAPRTPRGSPRCSAAQTPPYAVDYVRSGYAPALNAPRMIRSADEMACPRRASGQ